MIKRLHKIKTEHFSFLENTDNVFTLVLQMFLIIFLLFMKDNGYLSIFMPVILIPGLLFKNFRENKYYWTCISFMAVMFYLILDLVGYVPNHKHVFAYAIVAITIALFIKHKTNPLNFIKTQAKIIIGLCFLFATTGKFLAPEFLNGAFFEFTNTTDPRFFGFTSLIADIDLMLLKENETNFRVLLEQANTNKVFTAHGAKEIGFIGMIISYWTIFIEGMIAVSFCLPSKYWLSKHRNVFLVAFILTTYPIATVLGFAIILTALGFTQSLDANNKLTKFSWFYLAVYLLLPLNSFPFNRLFELVF